MSPDGGPSINDAGDVALSATLGSGGGIFVDPAAGPAVAAARTGDAAPGGSTCACFDGVARIDAAGNVAFVARPSGIFLPGSTYRKIFEEIGVSRSGTWATYSANVKQPPGSGGAKLGLFRCEGS
ncbi:MAG: hypothetical protein B6D46_07270 [Polyangiaceae bacterium UTPRO1]|nr:hypothetical protein [Myxococcales bacterium]OQY67826.1 MAG: hypothetical protein B6D46_07270 [Polyangiaceae bacterium UTPRO1]